MADIKGVIYREIRLYLKQPFSAFLSLVTPLLYFLLFGLGMARSGIVERNYLAFFLPGYAALSIFSATNGVVQGMFNERNHGMLIELLSCPVRITAYVLAKLFFAASVATVQTIVLIMGVVFLVPNAVGDAGSGLFLLVPLLFLTAVLVSSTVACIVAGITTIRSFIVVVNIVNPILMFASSIFYPIESIPTWLRLLAQINPLTWCAELVRSTLTGSNVLMPLSVVVVGVLIVTPAAVLLNRWRILTS